MSMKRYILILVVLAFFVSTPFVHAEESKEARRVRLEAELSNIEKQILAQQVLVDNKQDERQSLERDVAILDAQIRKAQLGIQARSVQIQQLGSQIGDKQQTIGELSTSLDRQRQSLGQLLRKTNEIDEYSLVEMLMGSDDLSQVFVDLDSYQSIKSSLNQSVDTLKDTRSSTEEQKTALEDKQAKEVEFRRLQELEKKEIEKREAERTRILAVTKGEEAAYQALLAQQQKSASQIRQQLFELRDSGAIPFPQAVEYAEFASAKTGVRTALIMGILTQETRLGENLGVVGRWKTDMHPKRDQPIFTVIASAIGFDADSVPVSAAAGLSSYGGAMGPSQFIPSTWAIYGGYVNSITGSYSWGSGYTGTWSYDKSRDVIRELRGKSTPSSPFENQDAFLATALLMRDNGAAAGTYAAERLAALRYFAGWGGASNPAYAPYGDGVMQHTERIQQEINILKGG